MSVFDQAAGAITWNSSVREVVREKYAMERDKRLRPDGPDQYITVDLDGEFSDYLDDPYCENPIEREPVFEDAQVVVIGGGFSGLLTGARLRQAGIADVRLIERGSDFGGTWYWNRYPGAQCDTEAYIYMPLLEELGYVPSEKYAHAPEILDHSKAIARKFELDRDALLQTEVTKLDWDEDSSRWVVRTNRGDVVRARFVVWGCGPITRPKLPGIPGIRSFKGESFHSSRWNYDYTGGNNLGNLTGLVDKRVAIIGTGATSVQIVPHLGAWAKSLFVFERTPSSIDVRDNRPTDPQWAATLQPGWQKNRMQNFTNILSGIAEPEDLVNDGWTSTTKMLQQLAKAKDAMSKEEFADLFESVDYRKMEAIRRRVDSIVGDPVAAEALKPYYNMYCKRPCFHDEYLDTFNRPNVTLVDTNGNGVERVTERGLVANGVEYEVDCIIYATGFENRVAGQVARKAGIDVHGRNGVRLDDRWSPPRSFFAAHVREFPNLFFITYTAGNAATANVTHSIDVMAGHIAYVIEKATREGIISVEPSEEAVARWVETCRQSMTLLIANRYSPECTPGYYNNEGRDIERHLYAGTMLSFIDMLEEWRAKDDLGGLELSHSQQ
jgi:cyclohexanone monooxygenase